jgi:hypothetical protein
MHALLHALRTGSVALAALALVPCAPAWAETARPAGVVTALSGTATVTRASLGTPRALKFRDEVMLQDRIVTGEQSLARILLGGKAVITVRERSVVTITDSPRVSTVDVESGKVALAVAKERMRPGESIQLRTPNAVAGIRGTVVIAEVTRRGADTSTRFTLLTGVIDVLRLDAERRPIGAASILTPMQTISIDRGLSPVSPITRAEGEAVSAGFRLPVKVQPKGAEWVAKDQVTQAITRIESVTGDRGGRADPRSDVRPDTKTEQGGKAEAEEKIDRDRVKLSVRPPEQGGKADVDDKPERVRLPVGAPSTPVVPSYAVQGSGKGKHKGKDK